MIKRKAPHSSPTTAGFRAWAAAAWLVTAISSVRAQSPIQPSELVAPKIEISGGNLNFTVQPSLAGRSYQLQWSETMAASTWQNLGNVASGDGSNLVLSTPYPAGTSRRFYRLVLVDVSSNLDGFALIPAGSFTMGDQSSPKVGLSDEVVHTVNVSAFYLAKTETTFAQWQATRAYATANSYIFTNAGAGKAGDHPVQTVSWYDVVKWCNAKSQQDGLEPCYTVSGANYKTGDSTPDCDFTKNGYRLPTEAEWEKAARGGQSGLNFPWGNTITHSQVNYLSSSSNTYDVSPTRGRHPSYLTGGDPTTSPVGAFPVNGYGLADMSGNVWEW